jgi:hypothetical protein
MNEQLRADTDLSSPQNQKYSAHIQRLLHGAPKPPPPEVVWRKISTQAAKQFAGLGLGDEVKLKGFQSTSMRPGFGGNQVNFPKLEIKPVGGAWVKPISLHSSEEEYLLPHNASFKIVGFHEAPGVGKVIQLEMLDHGDQPPKNPSKSTIEKLNKGAYD